MAQTRTASQLVADLDRAIERVEAEARSLAAQAPPDGAVRGGGVGALDKPAGGEAGPSLEDLTVFLSRLKQMKEWLQEDARLLPLVDGVIGQHVKAAEKRANALNVQMAVITTLVGALLGWLLSSVQGPASLLSQLHLNH